MVGTCTAPGVGAGAVVGRITAGGAAGTSVMPIARTAMDPATTPSTPSTPSAASAQRGRRPAGAP